MNKIIVLVGENISSLDFYCGGSNKEGLQPSSWNDKQVWVHWSESTSRKCPENNKHPRVYRQWLVKDLDYCIPYWNYLITTNSKHTIDILSELRNQGRFLENPIEIYGLDEFNKEILFKSTIDKEGYLDENWPVGFLSIW